MADLAIDDADGQLRLLLSGRLDASTVRDPWQRAVRAVKEARTPHVVVDAAGVDYCDGAGIAMLVDLQRQRAPGEVEVAQPEAALRGAAAPVRSRAPRRSDLDPEPPRRPAIEEIGAIAAQVGRDMRDQVAFVGETAAALVDAVRRPQTVRWRDVWRDLRARRRRRAADRRADLVPDRRDPRVPVGDPDEALRRGDLRRRPDRPRDAARARPADDRDPARRPLGRGVRRRDRHDERQPGGRRARRRWASTRSASWSRRGSSPRC